MAFWIPLMAAAAGAYASNRRASAEAKQNKRFNEGQAEVTRYSPWTGMQGEIKPYTYDAIGSTLQGGLSGFAMGSNITNNMNRAGDGATAGGDAAGVGGTAGSSPLGGNEMSNKLGEQSNSFAASMPQYSSDSSVAAGPFQKTPSLWDQMKKPEDDPMQNKYSLGFNGSFGPRR